MRFDDIAFLLQHCTSKIVVPDLKIRLHFLAAGARSGKNGPITGCGAKWSKSSLTFKITCKTDNNNPMRKGIKMTRIADRSARKMRCFVDIIFKEYAPN